MDFWLGDEFMIDTPRFPVSGFADKNNTLAGVSFAERLSPWILDARPRRRSHACRYRNSGADGSLAFAVFGSGALAIVLALMVGLVLVVGARRIFGNNQRELQGCSGTFQLMRKTGLRSAGLGPRSATSGICNLRTG